MQRIRAKLPSESYDDGMTLIELIVAMLVFAILSVGIAYTMISIMAATRDTRSREVAANLASQEIDLARSAGDVFKLEDATRKVTVNGTEFTIERSTEWIDSSGGDQTCGAGGGALQYKRVNVGVTWSGMRTTNPVRSDTLVSPDSKINDPAKGTIVVWVKNDDGEGVAGVKVSASPSVIAGNTAKDLTTTPLETNAQGCSYILKAEPGSYDVSVSKLNFISNDQEAAATATVGVSAGLSGSAVLDYEKAAKLEVELAPHELSRTAKAPTDLALTVTNTYGTWSGLATVAELIATIDRYAYTSGYEIIAGAFSADSPACLSPDPASWPDAADGRVGQRASTLDSIAGEKTSGPLPMGLVTIKNTTNTDLYLWAKNAPGPASTGDPGCATTQTYEYGKILRKNSSVLVAVPYGSWSFQTRSGTSGGKTNVTTSQITISPTEGVLTGAVATLDPRRLVS